jgi:hypothetical protein
LLDSIATILIIELNFQKNIKSKKFHLECLIQEKKIKEEEESDPEIETNRREEEMKEKEIAEVVEEVLREGMIEETEESDRKIDMRGIEIEEGIEAVLREGTNGEKEDIGRGIETNIRFTSICRKRERKRY